MDSFAFSSRGTLATVARMDERLVGVKVREKVAGSGVSWIFVNHNNRWQSKLFGTEEPAPSR